MTVLLCDAKSHTTLHDCIVMWCKVAHHPSWMYCYVMQSLTPPFMNVLLYDVKSHRVKVIRNSEDCFLDNMIHPICIPATSKLLKPSSNTTRRPISNYLMVQSLQVWASQPRNPLQAQVSQWEHRHWFAVNPLETAGLKEWMFLHILGWKAWWMLWFPKIKIS